MRVGRHPLGGVAAVATPAAPGSAGVPHRASIAARPTDLVVLRVNVAEARLSLAGAAAVRGPPRAMARRATSGEGAAMAAPDPQVAVGDRVPTAPALAHLSERVGR
jgi:hypothetical protein